MTRQLFIVSLILCAGAARATVDMTSPPLLRPGQSVVLRCDAAPAVITVQIRGGDGTMSPEQRLDLTEPEWRTDAVSPGINLITVRQLGPDGQPLDSKRFAVTVFAAPGLEEALVRRALPHLHERLDTQREAVLLALGPAEAWSVTPSCADLLADALGRAYRKPIRVVSVATGDLRTPHLLDLVDDWLEQYQPAAVLWAASAPEAEAGVPPAAAAGLAHRLVARVEAAGVDCLVATPFPRAVGGDTGVVRAMRHGAALTAALAGERLVVDSTEALWPGDAVGASTLELGLIRRIGPDGSLLALGQYELAHALLRPLSGERPPARPVEVTAEADLLYSEPSTLRFSLANRTAAPLEAKLTIFRPAGLTPADGQPISLPAKDTATLTRTVSLPMTGAFPADLQAAVIGSLREPILAALEVAGQPSRPLVLSLSPRRLGAGFVSEARLQSGDATARLSLDNRSRERLGGFVSGPPGSWRPTFEIGGLGSTEVEFPLPLTDRNRGAVRLAVEAAGGDERAPATAVVRYCAALLTRFGAAEPDGDLGEWSDAAWYAIGSRDQVIDAAEGWDGEADGVTRFALRFDAAALYLAAVATDDSPTDQDALELLWDTGDAGWNPVRRLRVPLGTQAAAGWGAEAITIARLPEAGVLELTLPWTALGLSPPEPGALLGFDLVRLDDDADQAPARLSYTGERWAGYDSSRLARILVGLNPERVPLRLLVAPDDGEPPL